jgi:RNA polymerase sigma factor (sigma-70 family)
LVDRHIATVHSAARRIIRDEHLAEDVTQSVFILLSQRAHKIPPTTPLIGWLYKVTQYACANLQRMERNRRRLEQKIAAMRPTSTSEVALSDAEICLDAALRSLSGHERDAILLRYSSDLSVAEIAGLTHVSHETAKKRLHRGLANLRKYFAAQGVAEAGDIPAANPCAILALGGAHSAATLALAPSIASAALASVSGATGAAAGIGASTLSRHIAQGVSRMMTFTKIVKVTAAVAVMALTPVMIVSGIIIVRGRSMNNAPAAQVMVNPNDAGAPAPGSAAAPGTPGTPGTQRVVVGGF